MLDEKLIPAVVGAAVVGVVEPDIPCGGGPDVPISCMLRRIGCDGISIGETGATTMDGPTMGAEKAVAAGEVTEMGMAIWPEARGRLGMVGCVGVVGVEAWRASSWVKKR